MIILTAAKAAQLQTTVGRRLEWLIYAPGDADGFVAVPVVIPERLGTGPPQEIEARLAAPSLRLLHEQLPEGLHRCALMSPNHPALLEVWTSMGVDSPDNRMRSSALRLFGRRG